VTADVSTSSLNAGWLLGDNALLGSDDLLWDWMLDHDHLPKNPRCEQTQDLSQPLPINFYILYPYPLISRSMQQQQHHTTTTTTLCEHYHHDPPKIITTHRASL